MLVLTRKLNEQIQIGDDVTITVIRVKGNTIRLGIEAPRTTRIVRGELEPFDRESGTDAKSTASQTRSAASKRTTAGDAAGPIARTHTASPLAAYMPARANCVRANLASGASTSNLRVAEVA